VERFSLTPQGPFSLAEANQYFSGWPTLAADPNALVMAFPVEGWRTSAAVVVRQEADGAVVGEVSDDEVTSQAVQHAYGLASPPDRASMLQIAAPWRPYRAWGMVLLHMWLRREGPSFQRPGRGSRPTAKS
jgi:hypothetical protein